MSSPSIPGELKNVRVEAISLVTKAANGKTFKIFKAADPKQTAPDTPERDEQGLFSVLKKFFTGDEGVKKGEVANLVNARDKGKKLEVAVDALWKVLGYNYYGDTGNEAVTDVKAIRSALEDFKKVAEEILIDKDLDVVKAISEVQKSGRKISSARLAELRAAQAALTKVIEESEDSEGGAAVEKQELENIVKSVIEGAIKPLGERIEKLESVGEPEDKASELTELVKSAVTEAISPLEQRISKVESARGFSNKVPEDTSVRKGEGGIWEGLF